MANIQVDRTRRIEETREKEVRQVSWKPAHDLPVPKDRKSTRLNSSH